MKPFYDKILIQPHKSEAFFDENKYKEVGTVVDVGSQVKFVKKGDIIYFNAEGVRKIKKGEEEIYVVSEHSEFILAKESKMGK